MASKQNKLTTISSVYTLIIIHDKNISKCQDNVWELNLIRTNCEKSKCWVLQDPDCWSLVVACFAGAWLKPDVGNIFKSKQKDEICVAWRAIDRNAIIKSNWEFSVPCIFHSVIWIHVLLLPPPSTSPWLWQYYWALTFMKFYVSDSDSD